MDFTNELKENDVGGDIVEGITQNIDANGMNALTAMLEDAKTHIDEAKTEVEEVETVMQETSDKMPEIATNFMGGAAGGVMTAEPQFLRAMAKAADDGMGSFATKAGIHSPSTVMYGYGINLMAGLQNGITAGRSGVVQAMISAAQSAITAAKDAFDIHSPSKVFRDEVGSMVMRGFGEGVLHETEEQAKIIRNASRYLTGEAQNGTIATTSNDNRKTYNNTNTISFAGSNFYVNDKQDAYALAVEIAGLTKRQQRGKGLRMA